MLAGTQTAMANAAARCAAALATTPRLRVGGLEPFSSSDCPGALAAVLFCQGCPWRCGYCHNPHLIPAHGDDEVDFGRILEWLASRRGLLDAVVFSGGEPTAQRELSAAIDAVRALGFAVGLHTSGAYPRRLAGVLPKLDWVGIDIKAPIARYETMTAVTGSGAGAFASLDLVRAAGIAHEVRTTVHPLLTSPEAIERLARELAECGVERWILQAFRPNGCANAALVAAGSRRDTLDQASLSRLRAHVPVIELRV